MKRNHIILLLQFVLSGFIIFPAEATVYERVSLQTDKYFYLAGEVVNFKVVTTNKKNEPQDLSKVVYVELTGQSDQDIKLMIETKHCTGDGSSTLPISLPSGQYELVAYTAYMQNEGIGAFSRCKIAIVNTNTKFYTAGINFLANKQPDIYNNVSELQNIDLNTDAKVYKTRQKAKLEIKNIPSDIFTLSVSITGEDIIKPHSPAYYTSNINPFVMKYLPEYEGHIIRGQLIDVKTGQPATKTSLTPYISFPGNDVRLFSGNCDSLGNISFITNKTSGSNELISLLDPLSGNGYRIDIHSPFLGIVNYKEPETLLIDSMGVKALQYRNFAFRVMNKAKADSTRFLAEDSLLFAQKPKWTYNLDEYNRFNTMGEVFIEFIKNARFVKSGNEHVLQVFSEEAAKFSLSKTLVLLDGIPVLNHEKIYNYNPAYVKRIDVYSGKTVFGREFYDGLVFFHTYKNNYPGFQFDSTMTLIDYPSVQAKQLTPSPSWIKNGTADRKPDFRHTLLWQPFIKLSANEQSTSIDFYTSDYEGQFKVAVKGITLKGENIDAEYYFRTEK